MRPLLTAVLVIAAAAFSYPAGAQTACGDRNQITDRLATGYSESRVGSGLDSNGLVVELFVSRQGSWTLLVTFPDGRTWTLMLTLPNGLSCLIAAGEYWQNIPRIILNGAPA